MKSKVLSRKEFLRGALASAAVLGLPKAHASAGKEAGTSPSAPEPTRDKGPLAITMWDFSWLERRWEGAGYEDWDRALDGLCERGYNAVRIDAFPHLIAADPGKTWTLKPVWNQLDWGSPDVNRVQVLPALTTFIAKCHVRGVKVGLSTWFREDIDNVRMGLSSPEKLADAWIRTLEAIQSAGLLSALLYVDLCNEWPGDLWAPFLSPHLDWGDWKNPVSLDFMRRALAKVRAAFPGIPLLFSLDNDRVEDYLDHPLPDFDAFEHHLWAAKENDGEYYREVGYHYERFDAAGFRNMSLNAERCYRERSAHWQELLVSKVDRLAAVSRTLSKPLMTTECWAVVDYKDWPLLKWDWVKELTAVGVRRAAASGQWLAIATSNFCGPQFSGMWNDVGWHTEQTRLIKASKVDPGLRAGLLWDRL